jgi:hypothetical protein
MRYPSPSDEASAHFAHRDLTLAAIFAGFQEGKGHLSRMMVEKAQADPEGAIVPGSVKT